MFLDKKTLVKIFAKSWVKLNHQSGNRAPRLRFFVYCICISLWHSHLNDIEIPETKLFILKGFELRTTLR